MFDKLASVDLGHALVDLLARIRLVCSQIPHLLHVPAWKSTNELVAVKDVQHVAVKTNRDSFSGEAAPDAVDGVADRDGASQSHLASQFDRVPRLESGDFWADLRVGRSLVLVLSMFGGVEPIRWGHHRDRQVGPLVVVLLYVSVQRGLRLRHRVELLLRKELHPKRLVKAFDLARGGGGSNAGQDVVDAVVVADPVEEHLVWCSGKTAGLKAVYVRDGKIARTEFTKVFEVLFSRRGLNKAAMVPPAGFEPTPVSVLSRLSLPVGLRGQGTFPFIVAV